MRRRERDGTVDLRSRSRLPRLDRSGLLLSIVMPVYNERETVIDVIDEVLALDLDGIATELVIVESNSTDGSRELVGKYDGHERVTVVYEDEPRGKGVAVRRGLEHVSGQIVLIQDADLEYDVADYPRLLEPLVEGRADFVLGSRHVPGTPIRVMHGAPVLSFVVNSGHWLFLALFNATYGVRLTDPFTMYKVFRAECIDGVEFVADRFDFDWELVAKLIRLGYSPLEVPVTYNARGFSGGKKVRFFRDPPTWVVACFRFRFSRLRRVPFAVPGPVPAGDDEHLADADAQRMASDALG
jgi:glycosyltransferase involved in cell wall biosynthesis